MFEASFHFTLSSKDKQMLVVSGHEYYLKRKNKTTTNWNCSKYQTHKCRATAITDGENFIETRGQPNHISTGKPDARLVLKNIKDLSDNNTPAVATAIQRVTDNIATQLALPSKENLVRTAQRARKQREEVLPVSPATRSFEIPELFKNFIRFDSGQNDHEKIILFGDPEMLRVLETFNFWLADGTLKVTPKMFYQLYSIHLSLSEIAPACKYAFLPNYGIQSYFSGSHPSIWKVIANLQKDASVQKLYFYNASSGH